METSFTELVSNYKSHVTELLVFRMQQDIQLNKPLKFKTRYFNDNNNGYFPCERKAREGGVIVTCWIDSSVGKTLVTDRFISSVQHTFLLL